MNKITCCCGASIEWADGPATYVVEEWIKRHDKCVKLAQQVKSTHIKFKLVCDRCGRLAHESVLEGKVCCMIQKDGSNCEGILKRKG